MVPFAAAGVGVGLADALGLAAGVVVGAGVGFAAGSGGASGGVGGTVAPFAAPLFWRSSWYFNSSGLGDVAGGITPEAVTSAAGSGACTVSPARSGDTPRPAC